ncbi:VacJ family lipoprotein [Minwuia sp.]|uniref:MlaA family lipoprotein n=1 Tax=Minwuia sp. TaxID=2493630 RepID=UPI003A90F45E
MKIVRTCAVIAIASFAWTGVAVAEAVEDPYESTNRDIFEFNMSLDRSLMRPVARGYRTVVPDPYRQGISSVLDNLTEPRTLLNNILQGEGEAAWNTFMRFMINSTVGLGGLFDITTAGNHERRKEDFGQTLAVWGAGSGPYLMLPVFGPSNGRDAAGFVVDTVTDPFGFVFGFVPAAARTGTAMVDNRSELIEETEVLEDTAIDLYASVRTLYTQNREHEIRNGAPPPLEDLYRDLELEKDIQVTFPRSQTN